jgi:predicted cytidylate kinase
MTSRRSVVINGDLGSGKSTVSVLLAARLGVRRISVGDLYRELASKRGVTALEINLHAELDEKIDHYVDQLQRDIAASDEQLIVDSRLAWHFFTDALKVHLITEPTVAARRVLGRPTAVENYDSLDEARRHLAFRSQSERVRFLTRYGADKARLRNYDVVCDSTRATPDEILDRIIECLHAAPVGAAGPVCHLDPRRVLPTADAFPPDAAGPAAPLAVGYDAPHFFAVRGHQHLSAAVRSGQAMVKATLAAESPEKLSGVRCAEYLRAHATPARIRDWERAHGFELPLADSAPDTAPADAPER